MLGEFAKRSPNLEVAERQPSFQVVTTGNVSYNDVCNQRLKSNYRVGGGDCLTNDDKPRVLYQPLFPAS